MRYTNSIATAPKPQPTIPDTTFPPLDTIYRPSIVKVLESACSEDHESCHSSPRSWRYLQNQIPQGALRLEQATIYQAYSRFICAFTGQEEIAFHTTIAEHSKRGTVCVQVLSGDDESPAEIICHHADETPSSESSIAFALNILAPKNVESHDYIPHDTPFTVTVKLEADCSVSKIGLRVERGLVSDRDATQIFNTLLQYLWSSSADGTNSFKQRPDTSPERSILNFPPCSRPLSLTQDDGKSQMALLHAAFERRVLDHPDRIALDFLQAQDSPSAPKIRRTFTYAALNQLTHSLAQIILNCFGPRTSAVVPILLSTSPELYISYLAVLKAGLAFCPLPVEAPPKRLQDIMDDLSPQVILGAETFRESLPALKGASDASRDVRKLKWIDVEQFTHTHMESMDTQSQPTSERALAHPQEDDVCYIMYTSGSSGIPKGVQITHLSATCSITAHAVTALLPPSPDGVPRWFQFAAPTFDPSLMEIFVPLSTGATLCSATRDLTLTDIEGTVSQLEATVMMSTPSMAATIRRSKLLSVRSLWTMGETLLRKNIDDFADPGANTELCNAYGPTEAAINCTLLPNFHPGDRGSIIGPALSTSSLFVIDPEAKTPTPVPRGFVGELAIGGPQVSIGYLNRLDQNLKSFVETPEFGRVYRTGDKARIVTDRNGQYVVEFLGRIDTSQVKLSGRRVDLGEIDTVISACKGVKEAVSVSYKRFADQHGSEEAVTFLVLKESVDDASVEARCRETAAERLLSYMNPSKYFFVDLIPRSLAGKVDRKALSLVAERLWHGETTENENPQTREKEANDDSRESLLSRILSQVLGTKFSDINPTTNFFSVGMDSLRAIRFLQLARDVGIVGLSMTDILQGASPRSLAALLSERCMQSLESLGSGRQINGLSARPRDKSFDRDTFFQKYEKFCTNSLGIDLEHIEKILPTTATQSAMLASFLRSSSSTSPSKKHYIHHSVHHINPWIGFSRLQKAWMTVLDRHEAYKMVFLPLDDNVSPFLQCVLGPVCPLIRKSWKEQHCEMDEQVDFDDAIQRALEAAEIDITLEKPPVQLTLVKTPKRKAIVCSIFHGIFDGASLQLLFDEVNIEYTGFEAPRRTEISTAVYMHFNSDAEATVAFWSAQLKDCDPTPFPSLTGLRPEVVTKIPRCTTRLATTDLNLLRDGARKCLASPLTILQAAWGLLLVTYKDNLGSSTFGSVMSGRLDQESEVCMGPTFTTIPVTIPSHTLKSNASNAAVLQQLTELNAKSLQHLQIPLNSITTTNGGLYYDTLLAFQDFASGGVNSDLWHTVEYPAMSNDFVVMIEVWPEVDGALRLRATYMDEYLEEASASLMLQQFSDMITFITQNPEQPYLDGRFATTPSQSPLAGSPPVETEIGGILHEQFEHNAKLYPDDIALVFKGDLQSEVSPLNVEWTYSELDRRANRLARYLVTEFGCLNDKVIPFSLEKSPELYVAVLGILKAGGAWCPIDPSFPVARRYDLIARTDARMLLVANNTVLQYSVPVGVIVVDVNKLGVESGVVNNVDGLDDLATPRPQDMAYLIWTSGTTGSPKGVQVQHNSAAESMMSLENLIESSDQGKVRCLQFSQPTFDVFVQDLFYTWGLRGTVISATKDIMLGSFAQLSNETKATHVHLTPAFATIVPRRNIKTLQAITMIGEALPQAVADDWGQEIKAYNTYGPAEVSVVSTVRQFGSCYNNFKSTNIGFTLPSVAAFVVNDGRVIMRGGVGELALAGPQVARGYWKDPTKTREQFLWNDSAQAHIYMTGDIVRQLYDGSFEFVGRRDDLVKLAGMRVELSEISFAVAQCHPTVEQVVTMHMARSDRPTKVIVVFLSVPKLQSKAGKSNIPITNDKAAEIKNAASTQAQRTLPEHMVPSVFIVLGRIPVTASAKIDRNALAEAYEFLDLETWESKISSAHISDWTEEESEFVELISNFSGTASKSINPTSRLAALGIDSIGAIRLTARLKSAGHAVSTADLLRSRTVRELCLLLTVPTANALREHTSMQVLNDFQKQWYPSVREYLKDTTNTEFKVCPLLPLQENLLGETFRNYESYWSNHFFDLNPNLDLDALLEAWKTVASQNEALRVGFVPMAALAMGKSKTPISTFIQTIYDGQSVDWNCIAVEADDFWTEAKRRSQEIALRHQKSSFLRPCWAVTVFDQGGSRSMMFTIHHSIHDGSSLEFIISDLHDAYVRSNFALKQRHQLRDAVATANTSKSTEEDDMHFWETALKDFIVDEDAGSKQEAKLGKHHEVAVYLSVPFAELQRSAQALECSSVTSILRVAWGCTVADLLEVNDRRIVVGEVVSERLMDSSLDDVIGPLVSLMPALVCGLGTTREIVARHEQVMADAWKHRNVNPGLVRKLIKRPKNQALYPAVFVFHPQSPEKNTAHDLWTETEDLIGLNVEHDLTLNVEQQANGTLKLLVSAEASVLSADGVELLAKQLDALISSMIGFPDELVSQLTTHFPRELTSVTKASPFEASDVVSNDNPLCWFEHWAQVHPDWPAAEIAESLGQGSTRTVSWTYSKLNEEANRVAAFIQFCGIHGRMIGMCLGRTLAAFAVTLGIFKSRNTYLPIDEDLPKERKAFLLQDSNAAIFFSTGSVEYAPEECKVVDLERDQYQLQQSTKNDIPQSKHDAAYLLYTSGTTGTPKGALISCGNLTSFSEAQSDFICTNVPATLELGGVGKYLGLANRAFDVHVGEMFLAWRWGLCCVTGKRSMLLDDLPLALKELEVTHASFVPSLLDQVGLVPAEVPLLKYIGVGGEKISQRTLESFGDSDTVALINAYGPTEVTIGCCSARVSSKSNLRNIGKVLGDTVAHVLIPGTLTYAKRGMEGELCLTGSLVGIGYHNRDTGAFVEDFNGEKMYRTGDLVRLMPDDSIEIFGRSDDQTKIRGQRLELGEVSECVRTLLTNGADVASLITKHPGLSRMQLVSFVAQSKATTGKQPDLLQTFEEINATIQTGCKERLPSYMIPDVVLPISFLPLAATSGKVDIKLLKSLFASIPLRKLLSTEGGSSSNDGEVDSRALNEDEEAVAELLRVLVKANDLEIKPSTNIFEVGIDSLVAISLSTLMSKNGYDCTVADVLGAVTVEDLALLPRSDGVHSREIANKTSVYEKLAAVEAAFRASEIGRKFGDKVVTVRPCLPVQEAVIARSLDKVSDVLYVNHIILELSADVHIRRFRDAWESATHDHEILRTCFCHVENNILQVVLSNRGFESAWDELVEPFEDDLSLLKAMQNDIAKDITDNIQEKPPIRINLMHPTSANGKCFLSISIHHALYDAESLGLLMEDIHLRYKSAELQRRPSPGSLVEYIASVDEQAAFKFWTKTLQDYRTPPLGISDKSSSNEAKICTRILKSSLSSLESCASHLKVTLPTLTQTIFGIAMAKAISVNDLVFGLVLSGRSVPVAGIEKLLAPSISTVPQRIDLRKSDASILDVLSSVQKSSGQMIQFQHTSLRAIHKWVKADQPLFNSLFSYVKSGAQPSYKDLWKEVESYMPPDYPFAVEFEARAASNDLVVRAGYTSEFGTESQVENLLEMMELLIDTIAKGEKSTIKSLGIQAKEGFNSVPADSANGTQESSELEVKIKHTLLTLGDFGPENITRHSTFFRLGVDSVIAIRFAQKLRAAGLEVSSSDIARYPSIAKMSEHISVRKAIIGPEILPQKLLALNLEKYRDTIPLLVKNDQISQIYACTPLQTGLLTQTIANGGRLYVHHPTVQLADETDIERLKSAWNSVIVSLDILRTTFHFVENSEVPWIAAVYDKPSMKWVETAVEGSIEQSIRDLVEGTTFTSPEAFSEPPVKITILKTPVATYMTVSLHHSLYDGWSLPLIFDTLSNAYTQGSASVETPFSRAANLITELQASGVNFWFEKIKDYTGINIPRSLTPAQSMPAFSKISIGMPIAKVLEKCKSMDINLRSAALLAYGKALCCLVKRRDIVFGHVVSGRSLPLPAVEQIIGPLFNTLPFRFRLDNPIITNQGVVTQVQGTVADGQNYQHASLNAIQRQWRQDQESDVPLLDALFVFQKVATANDASKQELWKPFEMEDDRDATEYGLNVELEQGVKEITLSASSSVGRLNHQDLATFCARFDSILRDILDSPSRSVTAYPEMMHDLPLSTQQKSSAKQTPGFEDIADNGAVAILRAAFADVSQIAASKIDMQTSIFSLGIDSIAAIRVVSICRRQTVKLSVADVLQGRSLGGIVRILMSKTATLLGDIKQTDISGEVKDVVLARIQHSASRVENVLPLVAGQVYHLASWLMSGRTFYEPTWAFVSDKKLDCGRLASAWKTLQESHSILRTAFVTLQSHEVYQIVLTPETPNEMSFSTNELSENLVDEVKHHVRLSAHTPSALSTPPISLHLIQGKNQDAVLVKLHHSLYDAWTMNSLISELSNLYLSQATFPTQNFSDFVWHINNVLAPSTEAAYWTSTLSQAEPTILSPRAKRPNETPFPNLKQTFVWAKQAVKSLSHKTKICKQSGAALSMIVILAFSRVLGQHTNTRNPIFGFFQAARSATFPDNATVDGPCVNILPFSAPVLEGGKTGDLETVLAIQEELGKRVPFEQSHLRNVLAWKEGLDPSSPEAKPKPLFNTSLNLLWYRKQTTGNVADAEPLLTPLDIGVPTDFASEEPIHGETAVDGLDTSYLAAQNLFVDIGPVEETDSIDFGVKCNFGLMDEAMVTRFVEDVAAEIDRIVRSLG